MFKTQAEMEASASHYSRDDDCYLIQSTLNEDPHLGYQAQKFNTNAKPPSFD